MKTILLTLFFTFLTTIVLFAQKHNNIWMTGYASFNGGHFGITIYDFAADTLEIKRDDYPMSFGRTHGVMCDSSGKLLFYTNGMYIANMAHDTMVNGRGLNPGFWHDEWAMVPYQGYRIRDGMIILPDLKDVNSYKLFHICLPEINNALPLQILTTTVDMNGDGGLGEVTDKNRILFQEPGKSLTQTHFDAVRHANGRDWWLVNMIYETKELLLHLYTPDSIYKFNNQTIVPHSTAGVGEFQFSPDGSKLAITELRQISTAKRGHSLHLYAFDRCSGLFTPIVDTYVVDTLIFDNGVIFSPSGRYLYQTYEQFIFRYDVESSDIIASKDTIATWDGYIWYPYEGSPKFRTQFGYGELGPDGNIYIMSASASPFIHKITYPDDPTKSEVIQRIPIPTANSWTVPHYPNYKLGPLEGSPCAEVFGPPTALYEYEAEALAVTFEDMSEGVPLTWYWDFGDGATSTEQHPQHTYTDPGVYTACLSATNIYGNSTFCRELKVETTSIHTPGAGTGFKVIPNPASDQVAIQMDDAEGKVLLYDLLGRLSATTHLRSGGATLSLHGLPAGVYIVQLKLLDGQVLWEKLVVE